MARPKLIINPLQGKRVKTVCEREKITQIELSKKTYISQQLISKIVNGRAHLTQTTAELICKAFPQYRVEWLMGMDDFVTKEELAAFYFDKSWEEESAEESFISSFFSLAGLCYMPNPPQEVIEGINMNSDNEIASLCDSSWRSRSDSCKITRSGITVAQCSLEDIDRLKEDVTTFSLAWINRLCEKGRVDNG